MRTIRLKGSGGHIFVVEKGEHAPKGEIEFSEAEWARAMKLGKDVSDPEAQKSFWQTILQKKKNQPGYSLFDDFPKEQVFESEKAQVAKKYCSEILDGLRGRKKDA